MSNARESKMLTPQDALLAITTFQSVSLIDRAKAFLACANLAEVSLHLRVSQYTDEEKKEYIDWVNSLYPGHLENKASEEQIKLLTPREKTYIGFLFFDRKEYERSIYYLTQAEAGGDRLASHYLGCCYSKLNPANLPKAKEFYSKEESVSSFNNLALILEKEGKLKEAFESYQKGCEKGDIASTHNLGLCYYYGIGCEKDQKKEFDCTQRSVLNGNWLSVKALASYWWHEEKNTRQAALFYRVYTGNKRWGSSDLGMNDHLVRDLTRLQTKETDAFYNYHIPICLKYSNDDKAISRRNTFNDLRRQQPELFYNTLMPEMSDDLSTIEPLFELNEDEKERAAIMCNSFADTPLYLVTSIIIQFEIPIASLANKIVTDEMNAMKVVRVNKQLLPCMSSLFGVDKAKQHAALIEQAEQNKITYQRAAKGIYGGSS